MADHGQPSDPPAELLSAARRVTPIWLRRSIEHAARHGGVAPSEIAGPAGLDVVVDQTTELIVTALATLLDQDVDEQRTNPLSIYRGALAAPTAFLRDRGAVPPAGDQFSSARLPDDPYRLGPATWSDIDDDMQMPGLVWGAWKAKTILDRRRAEGQR